MKKLFKETDIFQKERPRFLPGRQKYLLLLELAQEIIDSGWSDYDLHYIASDLDELSKNDSGFELAKQLDRNSRNAYHIASDFVEWLESFDYYFRAKIKDNVMKWVKAHSITAKFDVGTKLKVNNAFKRFNVNDIIYIGSINVHIAEYAVLKKMKDTKEFGLTYEIIEENCTVIVVEGQGK